MTLAAALALLLAAPAQPAAADLPMAVPSLSEARLALDAGRVDQAEAMTGSAIAAGAKGDLVERMLADIAFARGDWVRADGHYTALLGNSPDDLVLLEQAAITALHRGQAGQATLLLDRATRLSGAGWRTWNARGVAADRQGRWDEAEAAYRRAAEMDAGRAEPLNNWGWSLMLQGPWADAAVRFTQANAINPSLPHLANNLELATAALAADLPQRRAGEDDQAFAARLNDAGVAAQASGDTARARAAFAQALQVRSNWYRLAAQNLARLDQAAP